MKVKVVVTVAQIFVEGTVKNVLFYGKKTNKEVKDLYKATFPECKKFTVCELMKLNVEGIVTDVTTDFETFVRTNLDKELTIDFTVTETVEEVAE